MIEILSKPKQKECQTVVKVSTSYWHDKSGAYTKKSMMVLKRKSFGYNILLEECGMAGAKSIKRILNFSDIEDGIYELIVCNISYDCESGQVDNWDLKLIPFTE